MMDTRCEACHRPFTPTQRKASLWAWAVVVAVFAAAFGAGAIVETTMNLDIFGFALVVGGYAIGYGLMALWWHAAAKDY